MQSTCNIARADVVTNGQQGPTRPFRQPETATFISAGQSLRAMA